MFNDSKRKVDKLPPAIDKATIAPPELSLPKDGGAIPGIGEKFAANPIAGMGSMTVPCRATQRHTFTFTMLR